MTIFDNVFPLGLGTVRLPIQNTTDEEGIERSVDLVIHALDSGVNFIDTAHTYARGMALEVLKRVFQRTHTHPGVTIKVRLDLDKTFNGVMRRTEQCLKSMGISKAKYLYIWSLFSLEEFYQAMAPGGLYDAAQRLKDEGVIEHICCSLHAPPEEAVKIIESGVFEAATISYSIINALSMECVLQAAQKHHVGLAAMNPLGGGIIPTNDQFFSFAKIDKEETTVQAAMRFVQARPEIQVMLSGVTSQNELDFNLKSLQNSTYKDRLKRISCVSSKIQQLHNFCTGCNYCANCPQNIPISSIMQCRNTLLFNQKDSRYKNKTIETQENIHLMGKLERDYSILFESAQNPCIRCGKCEKVCTQHLNIMDAVSNTYQRVAHSSFSLSARKKRLDSLLNQPKYKKVGFYPGGMCTQWMLRFYRQFFGHPDFDMVIFDSNPAVWGTTDGGIPVYSPKEIPNVKPDCIIITSFNYRDEIYNAIKQYDSEEISIKCLYNDNDVPWLY